MGSSGLVTLTKGHAQNIDTPNGQASTPTHFLNGLATWFRTKKDASIGLRIADRASKESGVKACDEHFRLINYIQTRYKQRDTDPAALDDVIQACRRAIAIAPKVIIGFKEQHRLEEDQAADLYAKMGERYKRTPFPGVPNSPFYKRLAIILRKQGRKKEAAAIEARYETEWLPHTIDHRRAKQGASRG